MKSNLKVFFAAAIFLLCGSASAATLGTDYTQLASPQPTASKKIEVLEFFFYECSHCFHLHPELAKWEKTLPGDVELAYVPTIFRDTTEPLARTFFALEGMGKIKQLDDAIYQAIHVKQANFYDMDTIATFVGSNGVDKAKFTSAYNSFTVNSQVVRAKQMIRSYQIDGTPTLIVDGKYKITGLEPVKMISVLNDVIALARKSHAVKPH